MISLSSITLFPSLYETFYNTSIIKNARLKNILHTHIINLFDYVDAKKRIDSPIVGHGSGMLLGVDIGEKGFENAYKNHSKKPITIFFSPQGKPLTHDYLLFLYDQIKQQDGNVVTFATRYEGYDIRLEEEYADYVVSIGDFVTMGGDIPALLFIEALLRLEPECIGKKESVINDSFWENKLDTDHYANPDLWRNKEIPPLLKSGNHQEIDQWRHKNSLSKTVIKRFDWWRKRLLSTKEKKEGYGIIPSHYVALLHNDVVLPHNIIGESSVTSLDIHDIARSSATYGIKNYYIVTRLEAQRNIVQTFLDFWHTGSGRTYNHNRADALHSVFCVAELIDVCNDIKNKEGKEPIVIVTSSRREIGHPTMIDFYDQEKIWSLQRPVLFVFGTAHGISPELMKSIEYRLIPIEGLMDFNFLSVRSAAAIVLDRWLGLSSHLKNYN